MNIKKTIFLALMLVSTAGITQAMVRTDAEILGSVYDVERHDNALFEMYRATLADGTTVGFMRQKPDNLFGSLLSLDMQGNNFTSDEARENGFNYLRKKYNEQDLSYKLTQ